MTDSRRYEIKFVVNDIRLAEFQRWLWRHTGARVAYPQREVNSLYYDDIRFNAVRDNLAGLASRVKFRLRWYADHQDESGIYGLRLEKKCRDNRQGSKQVVDLSELETAFLDMALPDIQPHVARSAFALGLQDCSLENALVPVLHVAYKRQYFQDHDQLRITVDQDVRFRQVNAAGRVMSMPATGYGKKIIEMKFPESEKDRISALLKSLHLVPQRHSKYLQGLAMNGQAVYL